MIAGVASKHWHDLQRDGVLRRVVYVSASHEIDDKNELLENFDHDPELDNTLAFQTDPPKLVVHNAAPQTVQTNLPFMSLNAFT